MAVDRTLQLTEAATGVVFYVGEDNILKFYNDTLGAEVLYHNDRGERIHAIVSESPSQINTMSTSHFAVTTQGQTVYLNSQYVINIAASGSGSGADIEYDNIGAVREIITTTETKSALYATIQELAGATVYDISDVSLTNNTVALDATHGDVTTSFGAGVIFTISGSTGNDATYTVTSSTFTGGETVITVTETLPDSTNDGKVIAFT